MLELEPICEVNKHYYSQYEKNFESDLVNYQSRIYPSECAEHLRWYHIKVDNRYIGAIWLEKNTDVDFAVLGIFISDKEYRNRGIGQTSIKQILKKDISFMETNRVVLHVREENARAISCYKSVGFNEVRKYKKDKTNAIEMEYFA